MKPILQSIALLAALNILAGCTTYVDPDMGAPSSTTTTTTSADGSYVPYSGVTTSRTTTTR